MKLKIVIAPNVREAMSCYVPHVDRVENKLFS